MKRHIKTNRSKPILSQHWKFSNEEIVESLFHKTKESRNSKIPLKRTPRLRRDISFLQDIPHKEIKPTSLTYRDRTQCLPTSPKQIKKLASIIDDEKLIKYTEGLSSQLSEFKKEVSMEQIINKKFLETGFTQSLDEHKRLKLSSNIAEDFPKDFLYLGSPSGRQEVINLLEWLSLMKTDYIESMLHEVSDQEIPEEKIRKNLEFVGSVIQIGVKEVIRQVSVACVNRGVLLKELFDLQARYSESKANLINFRLQKQVESNYEQRKLESKMRENEVKELEETIEELKTECFHKEVLLEAREDELKEIKEKYNLRELDKSIQAVNLVSSEIKSSVNRRITRLKTGQVPLFSMKPKVFTLQPKVSLSKTKPAKAELSSIERGTETPLVGKYDKSTFTSVFYLEKSVEYESNDLSSLSNSHFEPDESCDVPNAIIVTTDRQETIIEYAFMPNKSLINSPTIKRLNTEILSDEKALLNPTRSESFINSRVLPEVSSLHLDEPNCSESSNTFSEIDIESEESEIYNLVVPESPEILNPEMMKKHTTNPDPFTNRLPSVLNEEKYIKKSKRRLDENTQTDRNELLETEDLKILQEMIEWKEDLLHKADREYSVLKGKIEAMEKKKNTEIPETDQENTDSFEELIEYLKKEGIIPAEATKSDWKEKVFEFFRNIQEKPQYFNGLQREKTITKFYEFNFQQPEIKTHSKKTHPAVSLISSIIEDPNSIEKHNTLTRKMLFKKLALIYSSAISRDTNGETLPCLVEFIHDEIQSKHQETAIGNKKFLELISSAIKNSECTKIQTLLRMVGLGEYTYLEDYIRPNSAFEFYVSLLSILLRSTIGIVVPYHCQGDIEYIPKTRAIECTKEIFSEIFSSGELVRLIKAIERTSRPDPVKINLNGVVSQDFVLNLAMEEYERHSRSVIEAVNLIVQGFDLRKEGFIHASDFILVVRHLNPEKLALLTDKSSKGFPGEFLSSFFNELAHGEQFINTEDMIELCVKRALLNSEHIRNFEIEHLNSHSETKNLIQSSLLKYLETIGQILQNKELLGISDEVEILWKSKIELLEADVSVSPKALLIAFKLFFKELDRLKSILNKE